MNTEGLIYVPERPEGFDAPSLEQDKRPKESGPVLVFKRKGECAQDCSGHSSADAYWGKFHLKRMDNMRDVLARAEQLGIITQRGPYLFFGKKNLGNGLYEAARKLTGTDYNTEAEVRVAMMKSVTKSKPRSPGKSPA